MQMRNLSYEHFEVSEQGETDAPVYLRSLLSLGDARLVRVRSGWRESASKTGGQSTPHFCSPHVKINKILTRVREIFMTALFC